MTTFNRSITDDNKPFWVWGPLLFSGFYFMQTIIDFEQTSMSDLFFIFVNYFIFIGLYAKAVNVAGDKVTPWLLALTLFISFTTYFTYGSQSLFGYVAFVAGYNLNVKRAISMLLVIWSAIFVSGYFFAQSHPYFLLPALMITAGLFAFGFFTQREVVFRLKEQANKKHVKQLAAIAERERIARDLHDVVGHSLSSIALKSELAEKYFEASDYLKAKQEMAEVAVLSREVLSEVRQTVSGLKQQKLSNGVEKLVKELENHGFSVTLKNQLSQLSLPASIESTIVLILTEAITNILRHSKGDRVTIELLDNEHKIDLLITSNGQVANFTPGNGLQGINERCSEINGSCVIDTTNGFTLTILLPKGI